MVWKVEQYAPPIAASCSPPRVFRTTASGEALARPPYVGELASAHSAAPTLTAHNNQETLLLPQKAGSPALVASGARIPSAKIGALERCEPACLDAAGVLQRMDEPHLPYRLDKSPSAPSARRVVATHRGPRLAVGGPGMQRSQAEDPGHRDPRGETRTLPG
ncbi:hypothetical protein FQZ97_390290 [compost metagenome]